MARPKKGQVIEKTETVAFRVPAKHKALLKERLNIEADRIVAEIESGKLDWSVEKRAYILGYIDGLEKTTKI